MKFLNTTAATLSDSKSFTQTWLTLGVVALMVALLASLLASCTPGTKEAIESRELSTSVKMSETIFLNPVAPADQVVWLRLRNTSDQQNIDVNTIRKNIETKLSNRGYRVTNDPTAAQYRLDANLRYADRVKSSLTADMATLGGFGGAIGGSDGNIKTMFVGGVLGAALGAAIGSQIEVRKYAMVMDVRVSEKVKGGVQTDIQANSSSAGKDGVKTSQYINRKENYLHHQTRIAVTAKQTNLDFKDAEPILVENLGSSLANIF